MSEKKAKEERKKDRALKPSEWVMKHYSKKAELAPTLPPPAIFQAVILEYLDMDYERRMEEKEKKDAPTS